MIFSPADSRSTVYSAECGVSSAGCPLLTTTVSSGRRNDTFGDLPGKWQPAILKAELNRPKLRVATGD
jgi:hypothetical protein